MLSFYMDQHIRIAITHGLRRRGIQVLTAHEDGAATLGDDDLLQRATSLGHVLVTQDQDFLEITADWQRSSREFVGLLFAIQELVDIGRMIEYLELVAHIMSPEEMRNQVEYIPLR
jgi:hypothetical protein